MGILNETQNFFRLYRHICGKSEVPDIYHFWAAVSLISATVEDRVWFQKFKHEVLYANLFVMLVGPSGLGKGMAIGHLAYLADSAVQINKYRGKVTAAHLVDHLGKIHEDEWGLKTISNPRLWIMMDELQNDLGTNVKLIEEFFYLMTELYTASNYEINTGTRTHGRVNIVKPIINWLAGTNEADLREILTQRLLRSGFTARTCFIFGDYKFDNRVPRVKYPGDYEEVFRYLCARLQWIQGARGPFTITEDAEAQLDKWYMTRANPNDELLYSAWKRQHDLVLKFAMILSLSDRFDLLIEHIHIIKAKEMVRKVYEFSEQLIAVGSETIETRFCNEVARYVKGKQWVGHGEAAKYFRVRRGVTADVFKRAVRLLQQEGLIHIGEVRKGKGKGALVYVWVGGEMGDREV